ncbi:hypothetical protein F5148DRAFT_1015458 [Russula earlei]|uniref:Uncharacterized protein n=1 Tax=Russula earlei TaxID=71964 RepID=A0ACC0U6T6_9AGAM|nr:hypothetical protein F5148DRAFT_1015458 [Russula earlei]
MDHNSYSPDLTNGLAPPPPDSRYKQQQRRVPPPALLPPPPPSVINVPQPVYGNNYPRPRSPSPLRSGFKVNPDTGEIQSEDGSDDDNDDDLDASRGRRSHSPNPSISYFASSFAQRVGSFVSSVGSVVSPGLPTDEQEAERDRERSRREAERILIQEAEERRLMEEKVLAMLQTKNSPPQHISPARSQSTPTTFENPSPTPSQRDSGVASWWSAAKSRLTPTKEPLTAAQQVIQETKEREKREKKDAKKAEKDRKRSADWPTTPESKHANPTLLSLATPPKASPKHTPLSAPPSPTPGLPSSLPPSLAPSPLRPPDSLTASPSRSPSRQPPPLYTQFNEQGTLDVPGTLLVIARRFEKLEKWTVGHVRALEGRMDDVERWLVEKENEKGTDGEDTSKATDISALDGTVNEMRDELVEMQGRIGELGREMAKFVTSSAILSATPSRISAQAVSTAPQTNSSFAIHAQTSSSITVHSHSLPPNTPPASVSGISSFSDLRRRDSVSPPFVPPSAIRAEQPRSRLPYPTGDYTSPPGSVVVAQGAFSPPQSPPTSNSASASPAAAAHPRPVPVSGLPAASPPPTASAPAGLPRPGGTLAAPPQPPRARSSSISPTPRKRYTVALGEPIMKPRVTTSPSPISVGDDDTEEEEVFDRTIGRSAGRHATTQQKQGQQRNGGRLGPGAGVGVGNGDDTDTSADLAPLSPPRRARAHTQTVSPGDPPSVAAAAARTNPLRLHGRALSTDRAARDAARRPPRSATTAGFRDPLVVRREQTEARVKAAPLAPKVFAGKPRAPVGEMVAYFDRS